MSAPAKRNARRAPGAFVEADTANTTAVAHGTQAPWLVTVNGRQFGKYATRAGALAIVRQLRGHGMSAVVEVA